MVLIQYLVMTTPFIWLRLRMFVTEKTAHCQRMRWSRIDKNKRGVAAGQEPIGLPCAVGDFESLAVDRRSSESDL